MNEQLQAVTGNTFPVKEQLKSRCGAKWDNAARVWMVPANKLEEALQIVRGNSPAPVARPAIARADFKWSEEQAKFVQWFRTGKGNYVVRARAGSGKTFTIIGGISEAPEDSIVYLVFGAKNRDEAVEKITDPRVQVLSLHQAGYRFGIKKYWPKAHIDRNNANAVEWDRIRTACGGEVPDEVGSEIFKLVGFAKNCFCGIPEQGDVEALAIDRDIECEAYEAPEDGGWTVSRLAEICIEVLKLTCIPDSQNRICFNDMVWLPVAMGWISPRFKMVVVDECQDQNAPQLAIARGLVLPDGRIAVVGDDRQAIYAFRGAEQNGISMMKEMLNAKEQGLTYTRRCAKAIVKDAATFVPDYKAFDDAPEGLVDDLSFDKLQEAARRGDAILSRLNAPLVPLWLGFIRKGIACKIEGKDQAAAFMNIIRKFKARSIPEVVRKAQAWGDRMVARLGNLNDRNQAKAELIRDQVETIIAIVDGLGSVSEIEPRIESIFADSGKDGNNAVILSTVHKAKGLEWNRVFILTHTFKFKGGQEDNVRYVAITRAKNHLTYVEGRLVSHEDSGKQ
jgi:Superfamily I DNA and RNA helicases